MAFVFVQHSNAINKEAFSTQSNNSGNPKARHRKLCAYPNGFVMHIVTGVTVAMCFLYFALSMTGREPDGSPMSFSLPVF